MDERVSLQETLLPALVQCFGIILIGYILGKTKLLNKSQAQGISNFVQFLSLPALIFVSVATIPFTEVKWQLIASIFVTKTFVFISVAFITLLLSHPHDLGKSAIFAISATQSNDFALGYPLFAALYTHSHPEYSSYLYIIAPTQLLVLNTVGFFFLEVEKHSKTPAKGSYLYHIVKGTVQNPVVIMTIVGLVWNVTYGQKMLPILDSILNAFSSAFPATALLLVGYTMTVQSETAAHIPLSVILITLMKNLVLPLILQKITGVMLKNSISTEIESFTSFAFLYGTLPTAPTAYVFAIQYNTCVDIVAKIIIYSTLLSAPLMFASASVISLAQIGLQNVSFYLSITISYLSCANLLSCVWVLLMLLTGKRWRSISFGVTFYLVLAQFLMSVGGIILFTSPADNSTLFYIQYILTTGSMYSTRMCAFLLAVLLLTIRIRSLCFILQLKKAINLVSVVICFILPYAIATCLLFCKNNEFFKPNFQLGINQIITTAVITSLCLSGTIVCGILQQVYLKKNILVAKRELTTSFAQKSSAENNMPAQSTSCNGKCASVCRDIEDMGSVNLINENCLECEFSQSEENTDEMICGSQYQCSPTKRFQCSAEISRYINENNEIGTGLIDNEYFSRHITLLIVLGLAMTLSLFVCIWKLLLEASNGIFVEIEFLDIIINYSLGVVCFIMFGMDSKLLTSIRTKLQVMRHRKHIQAMHIESKEVCRQFLSCHYEKCKKEIGRCKLLNNEDVYFVFNSTELTEWLLKAKVAETNEEACFYTNCLLKDRVIEELEEKGNSSNGACLFKFSNVDFSINV